MLQQTPRKPSGWVLNAVPGRSRPVKEFAIWDTSEVAGPFVSCNGAGATEMINIDAREAIGPVLRTDNAEAAGLSRGTDGRWR